MDQAMLEQVASMAANEAVQRTFLGLGVDISTPGKVIEAQEMFSGMRTFQGDLKAFKTRFWASLGGLAASAAAAIAYHYAQAPKPPI